MYVRVNVPARGSRRTLVLDRGWPRARGANGTKPSRAGSRCRRTAGKADRERWAKLPRQPKVVRDMLKDVGIYRVLEVDGDVHVRGDLDTMKARLGGLIVHGDLVVDGVFHDYGASLYGKVTARMFWPENHHFELAARPAFELCIGRCAARVPRALAAHVKTSAHATLAAAIDPALMSDDGLDREAVVARLRNGASIWKPKRRKR
jgi:hypothetical protein